MRQKVATLSFYMLDFEPPMAGRVLVGYILRAFSELPMRQWRRATCRSRCI
jgi:hypothetical protein